MSSKENAYQKTFRNLKTELQAKEFLLQSDNRFHDTSLGVKKLILRHLGFEGRLPTRSFDLVFTEEPFDQLTEENIDEHLPNLVLIEMKATKNKKRAVKDESLRGFFFGATENEFKIASKLGERYRFAFVVLADNNDLGRPFYVLLTLEELEKRIRTKRRQYQINL